jgi:hypothetical protein
MNRIEAYRMIRRRTAKAGSKIKLGCHVFRATGNHRIYLEAGGTLERRQSDGRLARSPHPSLRHPRS